MKTFEKAVLENVELNKVYDESIELFGEMAVHEKLFYADDVVDFCAQYICTYLDEGSYAMNISEKYIPHVINQLKIELDEFKKEKENNEKN